MINRILIGNISHRMSDPKAIILIGARQTGKSTSIGMLLENRNDVIWLNADEPDVVNIFDQITSTRLESIIGSKKVLVIDEAQRIPDIGIKLKLITDNIPGVKVIASGSSAFDLMNQLNETLTGRKWEFTMMPLSFKEMADHHGLITEMRLIPHRLIFGSYPDVIMHPGDEINILKELTNSYLYKDLLMLDQLHKADKLVKLLQALALQIGSQVSYNELAQLCGIDAKTVDKYIQLLEKSFIIFRLGSYSSNLRNELKFSKKIYFYDNGIRNAVLGNFAQIENRMDAGALWENYFISERFKWLTYSNFYGQSYFWRSTSQKDIDYIELKDGQLSAFEIKWNPNSKEKFPLQFRNLYPNANLHLITPKNCYEFLM